MSQLPSISLSTELNKDFKMCTQCELSRDTKGSYSLFLKAVTVWLKKPHVVNRRLCGAKTISVSRIDSLDELNLFLKSHVEQFKFNFNPQISLEQLSFEDLSTESSIYTVITRELIPKSEFFPKVLEVVIYDKAGQAVYFIPIADGNRDSSEPYFTNEIPYSVHFRKVDAGSGSSQDSSNKIVMLWSCDHEHPEVSKRQLSSRWLSSILLEKLLNWSTINDIYTSVTSLRLVDVEEYQKTYTRLKNTYGRDLVKNWTESTDPKKFVYEDIAIASYLLLIWEEDRRMKNLQQRQRFVDLGCGNGLLVYILTKEGHKGLGIDLRKRKIWDTFGSDVELQKSMVRPSADHLFPNYDWIIGNHSDELTPWIPVIAARSSYNCCFFVLPCCHYDFVGKFTASEKGKSKYASYLSYVGDVISRCGFITECDTLRIPSTKRISYIGRYRTYLKCNEEEADKRRQEYIDSHIKQRHGEKDPSSESTLDKETEANNSGLIATQCSDPTVIDSGISVGKRSFLCTCDHALTKDLCNGHPSQCKRCKVEETFDKEGDKSESVSQWAADFKPRVEAKVRNCQSVPDTTKLNIVTAVFNKVLAADKDNVALLSDGSKWCKGGVVPLNQVVSLFDKSVLQELKSECGGLQTLLRNHSHVFQVTKGNVQLRDFTQSDPWIGRNPQKSKDKKQNTIKTILCWYHSHHPDGCPKGISDCLFAHGKEDLKQKFMKSDGNCL